MTIIERLNIIDSIYQDVIDSVKRDGLGSRSAKDIFDYCVAKLNELMKDLISFNNAQEYFIKMGKESCKVLINRIEHTLSNIIARVTESLYKEESKTNFAMIYFNLAQLYLAIGKYHKSLLNIDMAIQYQKENLNDLEKILSLKLSINPNTKSKEDLVSKSSKFTKLGEKSLLKDELLTNKHYDYEFYLYVKMYWTKSHLHEINNDFTASINNMSEILKGRINILMRNLERQVYFSQSQARNKGFAILKLAHSTHRPSGFSDLSTNSRSSVNNTLRNKKSERKHLQLLRKRKLSAKTSQNETTKSKSISHKNNKLKIK